MMLPQSKQSRSVVRSRKRGHCAAHHFEEVGDGGRDGVGDGVGDRHTDLRSDIAAR